MVDKRDDWNFETFKEYVDELFAAKDLRDSQRFEAQKEALAAALAAAEKANITALAAAEKAVTKAEVAAEKRFDAVNEFRRTLSDIVATFMPRAETMALIAGLTKDSDLNRGKLDKMEGNTGGKHDLGLMIFAVCAAAFGFVSSMAALWALFHK